MRSIGMVENPSHEGYRQALACLTDCELPFLVGGALGFESYTGIVRRTKDLDVFVRPVDCERVLLALANVGYRTEIRFPHWLGKAWKHDHHIDVIFSSGNGVCTVDDLWFQHAPTANVLGSEVLLTPVEEMIWSKAFVMERNRYDGADIAHLLHARGSSLDWARLLFRFNPHWRVLFSHVILFGFIYPAQRLRIPDWFMNEMMRRLELDMQSLPADRRVCQGTLLSWSQYLVHVESGKYEDARQFPRGRLTKEETRHITDVFHREESDAGKSNRNGSSVKAWYEHRKAS